MLDNFFKFITNNKDTIEILVKMGTLVISLFTLMLAVFNGIKTLNSISNDRKNKRLSEFIAMFSDENEVKRLSAISGVSRYSRKLFRELFFICAVEEDSILKELLFENLKKQSPKKIKECKNINTFLVDYLVQNRQEKLLFSNFNDIDINNAITSLKNSQIKRRIQFEINKKNQSLANTFENVKVMDSYIPLSSNLLGMAIRKSCLIRLCGNFIMQSNMYKSKWFYNFFQNCVIIKNVIRHIFSCLIKYSYCYIDGNSYLGGIFWRSRFLNCMIRNSSFRESRFFKTVFENGNFESVIFSKSIINKCSFIKNKKIKQTNWNGTIIKNSNFDNVKFIENQMCKIHSENTCFSNVSFWRSKVLGKIKKCRFVNVKWGGTNLNNVRFENCVFKDVDFSGVKAKYVKFINCIFVNSDVEKIKQEYTKFINCKNN